MQSPPLGTLTVKKARWNKKILVVAFEEVTNRNQAEELRDTRLTFDSSAETDTASDDEGYYEHELLDLPVYLAADIKDGYLPEEPHRHRHRPADHAYPGSADSRKHRRR